MGLFAAGTFESVGCCWPMDEAVSASMGWFGREILFSSEWATARRAERKKYEINVIGIKDKNLRIQNKT